MSGEERKDIVEAEDEMNHDDEDGRGLERHDDELVKEGLENDEDDDDGTEVDDDDDDEGFDSQGPMIGSA